MTESLKIFVWIFFLFGASFLLGFFWSLIFTGKKYQYFLLPGVIIHELSHIIGCLISGADIKEVKIFSPKGSYVSHTKPRLPLIGSFIVSFAPVFGGLFFLVLAFRFFNYAPPLLNISGSVFDSFFLLVKQAFSFSLENYSDWSFWVFSYISLSIIVCLVPSKQDLRNSFLSLVFVFIFFSALFYFNVFTGPINGFLNNYLIGALSVATFFGLIALIITVPVYLLKKIIF
jgi:hypothetical protein